MNFNSGHVKEESFSPIALPEKICHFPFHNLLDLLPKPCFMCLNPIYLSRPSFRLLHLMKTPAPPPSQPHPHPQKTLQNHAVLYVYHSPVETSQCDLFTVISLVGDCISCVLNKVNLFWD